MSTDTLTRKAITDVALYRTGAANGRTNARKYATTHNRRQITAEINRLAGRPTPDNFAAAGQRDGYLSFLRAYLANN